MNKLIQINTSNFTGELVQTVNARDLHDFLDVKSRFNDWIVNRIRDFDFVENKDFITVTINLVNGGKAKECHITIDMAKELSMVERSAKGKEARQYFLDCEKALKAQPVLTNTDLLRLGYEAAQERDKLQLVIQEQAPKVKAFEELEASDGTMSITMAAKALSLIPAKILFTWLVDIGWINRKRGEKDKEEWECKAYAIERCFMESIARVVKPKNKPSFVVMQPVVTAKGLSHLAKTKDAYFSRLYSRSLAA
jgi:anti-repressor protein